MTVPSVELPPRPAPLRAFPVVAVVRVVVTAAVQVGTVVVLPAMLRGFQAGLDRRFSRSFGVPVHSSATPAVVGGVAGAVVGLVWLVGWAVLARAAWRGTRWGAVGTAVLSATALLGIVLVPFVVAIGLHYPAWLLVLTAVGVLADLAVVVVLVAPATRRWYAAVAALTPAGPDPTVASAPPGASGPTRFPPGPRH